MNDQDRQAIDGLFSKLSDVERQSGPRDAEAEAFIRSRIAAQPGAPYFMAQTIVVQEQALYTAQARLAELEQQVTSRPAGGGGFLSGLFGGEQPQRSPRPPSAAGMPPHMSSGMPPGMGGMAPGRGGGGFLAGAAQTAMGVAGGVLLGNMIAGALGGEDAKASEANQPEPAAEPAAASAEDGEFGGDFGDNI
jgi:hypothetical protein